MRTDGITPYITPRQSATESSTTPKSVMNTIVGGYFASLPLAAWEGAAMVERIKKTGTRIKFLRVDTLRVPNHAVIDRLHLCRNCLLMCQTTIMLESNYGGIHVASYPRKI